MASKAPGRRVFRTVLFTDIVGSTELAAELGDRRWRRTVAAHHTAIRRELRRHRGHEVDTAGDGFFAIFENPTDALRCAAATIAAAHALGLSIRAGLHTGEVEPAGDKFGGIAVHIGARLLGLAGPREVIVSNTVRELVAGSGHEFEDRGVHQLKGVPGEWHVYALVMPRFEEGVALVSVDDDELRAVVARRQRLVVFGLIGVIGLLVAVLVGVYVFVSRAVPPPTGPDTVVAFGESGTAPIAGWAVGRGPADLALADNILWVASTDSGTVTRVDVRSGAATSLGQVGTRPSGVVVADGLVWVADRYSSQLAVLDARQGNLLERLDLHASAIAPGTGRIWLADDLDERIVAIDSQTQGAIAEVALAAPAGPTDIAATTNAVWLAAPRAQAVLRADPATGTVGSIELDVDDVRVVAALGEDVWVASPTADRIARVESGSGRVAVRVDVCDTPIALAPTPAGVWVACAGEHALWMVDRAGAVITQIPLDGVPTAVAADGTRAWVALRAD